MSFSDYTIKPREEILQELAVSETGLSTREAAKRQKEYGLNEISGRQLHWWDVLLRQFKSSFLYLLLAAALFSFLLGETLDGLMILLFVGINAVLGFYQEYRSELTLKLLKQYIIPKTKVYRDGQKIIIKSTELVPGDIVDLEPGDMIPADLRFIEVQNITIDESILTGESPAVEKIGKELENATREIYQASNLGFSGTTVVTGSGRGVVFTTGRNTVIGEIASLTTETKHVSSFEKGLAKFSTFILRLVVVTLIFIVLANILIKGPETDIPTLIIFAIALAVSVIPEALMVVTTFSLSRGALHLAKNKVVIKRLSSIEDLGSIEVLCTDKTGTITENKLTVDSVYPRGSESTLLLYAILGTPSLVKDANFTDSFDTAVWEALSTHDKKLLSGYEKIKSIPFDPTRRRTSVLTKNGRQHELIVRGAPENIFSLCKDLDNKDKHSLNNWLKQEGKEGKRVIAVAKRILARKNWTNLENEEKELEFIGLISFTDPLKKTAPEAISKAEALGVKIKILTGDSAEVAGAIACSIGLTTNAQAVITGDEFDCLSSDKQHEIVEQFSVFARATPLQKHKIVQLLQEKYEVGFLGEGINDAPALKAANVSIVVQSASDISREASDIILLHKSLNVVVDAVREGREIFANTAKYIRATLASNFGNFYAVAITSLFVNFLPLLPLQILLINLFTDFPMIAVVTDNVDREELKRPKSYDVKEIVLLATYMGIVSSIFDLIFFVLFYRISPQVLRTNWFIGSVLTELVFLFSIRTRFFVLKAKGPSSILLYLSALVFATTIALPFTAFGHRVFDFITPNLGHLLIILFVVILYFIASEGTKLMYYRLQNSQNKPSS